MAGSNVVVKQGSVIFKEGDAADGMYLVRNGELEVFLEREGNHVKLASIGAGGMIGEMAFFDQKPRSASVRAVADAEVTVINNDDFQKLMRQIPKWFVSIMSSLSSRLRDTNTRLQKLEAENKGQKGRYETLGKMLHVLNLLWHKDGFKEGRDFCLNSGTAEKELANIFRIEPKMVKTTLQTLVNERIISSKTDQYNNAVLSLQNRGALSKLVEFIDGFLATYKDITCFPAPAIDILVSLQRLVQESAYDAVNIPFEEVIIEGDRQGLDTSHWKEQLPLLKALKDPIQLVKVNNTQIGFRTAKKELPLFIANHRVLAAIAKAGLDR